MDPSQHTRNKEESKQWIFITRPTWVCRPTIYWDVFYYAEAASIRCRFEVKAVEFGEEKRAVPPGQCTVHTCAVAMVKLHELRYELVLHPSYATDLRD